MDFTRRNALVEIVNDDYRRQSLAILSKNQTITLEELATRLIETLPDERTPEKPLHTEIELEHVHLPKLRDMGLISYSHDSMRIRVPEDSKDEVSELLDQFQFVESIIRTKSIGGN